MAVGFTAVMSLAVALYVAGAVRAGSGVFVPSLERVASRINAVDVQLGPCRALCARLRLRLRAERVPLKALAAWAEANARRVDCIFALDVLEHVVDDELALYGPRGALPRLLSSSNAAPASATTISR